MSRALLREPLVQFLVLGAALFALDAWLRPPAPTAGNPEIVVSVGSRSKPTWSSWSRSSSAPVQ
jgi:hypothetical protein